MAVSVAAKETLKSNPARVNSGLLLSCLPDRIDHLTVPFKPCFRESDPGANREVLWMYE